MMPTVLFADLENNWIFSPFKSDHLALLGEWGVSGKSKLTCLLFTEVKYTEHKIAILIILKCTVI